MTLLLHSHVTANMGTLGVQIIIVLNAVLFWTCSSALFTMLSHDQQYIVDVGAQLSLRCEFFKAHFNLFDNPVQWKKSQYGEETELNILGNVREPFDSTGRFKVTYNPDPPRYTMELTIRNLSHVDSGNYTCDVSAPEAAELGLVRYTVFVKAPVEEVRVVRGDASSTSDVSPDNTITFIDNELTPVRCIARGGSPPPEMKFSVGREDYTKYFRFDSVPTKSGKIAFRTLRMTTMLVTDHFPASARDDGKLLKCIAQVSGLAKVVKSIRITVNYAPRIECTPLTAYIGERNIRIICDVTAQPAVTSWYWVLDDNGTTVSEGDVLNGYWTIEMHTDSKMQLMLYLREVFEDSFRKYTLFARNAIAKRMAQIHVKRRYREAESNPHASVDPKNPYRKQQSSGHSNRDPSQLISGSASLYSSVAVRVFLLSFLLCLH